MKNLLIITSLLFLSYYSRSQNTGLYGKRTFVEINSTSNIPIFSWLWAERNQYKASGVGSTMYQTLDKLNYGIHGVVGRSGKKNVGFSLEFGYDFQNIAGPDYLYDAITYTDEWGYENSYSLYMKHERLDVRTITIMPKLEITKKGGTLPVGLNHQIGLGYTISSIKEKDYVYTITEGEQYLTGEDSVNFEKNLINFDQKYKGFTLLYAFNVRTPISRSLMINYGIRYTLNLRNFGQFIPNSTHYYSEYDIKKDIGRTRALNFLTFNIGLTYAF